MILTPPREPATRRTARPTVDRDAARFRMAVATIHHKFRLGLPVPSTEVTRLIALGQQLTGER